jgi:YjjG family noncanonical pyrimidine nucleotidase
MKKYENILFDLDMTLLDFQACEFNALKKTFNEYGIDIDERMHRLYSEINDGLWKRLEKGELVKKELGPLRFSRFLDEIKLKADACEVDKKYKDNLSFEAILMDGATETCKSLCRQYNLYVITNGTDYIQRNRLKLSGLEPFIKRMITSDEAGIPKPKAGFFDFFFNETKLDKSTCLIVGDSITSDILGGVNYGIDTCLVCQKKPEGEIKPDYSVKSIKMITLLLQQQL